MGSAIDTLAKLRELARDPDWDDCDMGDAQRALPALLAVAEAADFSEYESESGQCVCCNYALDDCECGMVALRSALRALREVKP